MRPEDQEPVQTEKEGPAGKSFTLTHPAFAQIGASRVSGLAHLYGSDFTHQHYMTITIRRSELHRDLSRDWPFGREELIEVALSEAQWATFISTPNSGSGVQCTLSHINGKMVPGITAPKPIHEKYSQELKGTLSEITSILNELAKEMDGALSKTKVADLRKRLEMAASKVVNNTGFVANQFDEHMEHTVEKAKVEVNAYVTGVVQRAGLDAIAEKGVLALEFKGEKRGNNG